MSFLTKKRIFRLLKKMVSCGLQKVNPLATCRKPKSMASRGPASRWPTRGAQAASVRPLVASEGPRESQRGVRRGVERGIGVPPSTKTQREEHLLGEEEPEAKPRGPGAATPQRGWGRGDTPAPLRLQLTLTRLLGNTRRGNT